MSLTNAYQSNPTPMKLQNVSLNPESSLLFFPIAPHPHPPRSSHCFDSFHHRLVLFIPELHIYGTIKYLLFYTSFTQYSFEGVLKKFYSCCYIYKQCVIFLLLSSIHCKYHSISIHSLIDGYLSVFQSLFIMKNNVLEHLSTTVFVDTFSVWGEG